MAIIDGVFDWAIQLLTCLATHQLCHSEFNLTTVLHVWHFVGTNKAAFRRVGGLGHSCHHLLSGFHLEIWALGFGNTRFGNTSRSSFGNTSCSGLMKGKQVSPAFHNQQFLVFQTLQRGLINSLNFTNWLTAALAYDCWNSVTVTSTISCGWNGFSAQDCLQRLLSVQFRFFFIHLFSVVCFQSPRVVFRQFGLFSVGHWWWAWSFLGDTWDRLAKSFDLWLFDQVLFDWVGSF